ncbi:E3 ubiquitin protein ligase RIN3-like [Olea europaea var. sylvestris]|uniref:E3 ubiquitin protein ligase RIN3-like n=1 Tax=Olea europaea var. sylvestris TaxID=158386 RepID=UPI000C1D193B|nr:E3 ubiquitin protein ligase RIN3-like [Olea europaea var. sylvestris]
MFQALARDRLERLNASPSAIPRTYFRVYSALLLVFSVDLLWIWLCFTMYSATSSSVSLLLFFEPTSIAFETLQAMVVHGFQLLEIWLHHSAGDIANYRLSKTFDVSPAGGSKSSFIRTCLLLLFMCFILQILQSVVLLLSKTS